MLLKSYTTEIFRPACNPGFKSLHCIAHLEQDVSRVLPYLNAVLGGFEFIEDPPAVTFLSMGRLISVHSRKIAINALKDVNEADKILKWLVKEINTAWENRSTIQPSHEGLPRPSIVEIMKCLPKTNCRQCNEPTCLVFACRLAEGVYSPAGCPLLSNSDRRRLEKYMMPFQFHEN
ncbi:MAG: Fe-S cluster protein [Deltaproteobacteria bacterium]|nr:Fe-S cluster protein [Deltaproteobacteria bacterium]